MPRPTVAFYLLSRLQSKGRGIMMRVSCASKGEPVHFYTGHVIDPKSWDETKQRMNSRYLLATVINRFLDTWHVEMEGLITNYELSAKPYTLKELQKAFNKKFRVGIGKQSGDWKTLIAGFPEWLRKNGRKAPTIKNHISRVAFLEKFMTGNITTECLHDYVDYMFDVEKLEPSTIDKRLDTVRQFLRYLKENDFDVPEKYIPRRKIKLIKKPAISVRPEEYRKLLAYKPWSKKLQAVKDMFILGYNTALRISDSRINPGDIDSGRIIKITRKTDAPVSIPLSADLEEVLKRYDYKMPELSPWEYNRGLKKLFEEAGLDRPVKVIINKGGERTEVIKKLYEVISSKAGRKSFISAMKAAGVPDEFIKAITGHSSALEMEPYISVNADEAAKKVKQALGG